MAGKIAFARSASIRPEACDKERHRINLLTMRIQDGNCACTCDRINEDARDAIPRNNLLGLSKKVVLVLMQHRIISTSAVSNLSSNRNSTDLSKLL